MVLNRVVSEQFAKHDEPHSVVAVGFAVENKGGCGEL